MIRSLPTTRPSASHRGRVICLALVAALAACEREEPVPEETYAGVMTFDSAVVRVVTERDTIPLRVELAETDEQRTMGLMERRALARDAGMLFLYGETQPENAGFWMFRTRIPLDIAFVDSTGTIRAIVPMEPCPSPYAQACPSYPPGVPYRAALEVARGVFAERGIDVGDRIVLADTASAAR